MPVTANTELSYDVTTIREDLRDAYDSISPMDMPFQKMIGRGKAKQVYHEFHELDLATPDSANRVLEGEANPATDAATLSVRKGNYCQLSDKKVTVSSTANASNGAGNVQTLATQVSLKLKEIKRDIEAMLLDNVAANPGAAGTARAAAGFPAHIVTNVNRGSGGANGSTSGAGGAGYVDTAATDGTLRALTEDMLKSVLQQSWTNGAEPKTVMCGGLVKQKISTFSGNNMVRNGVADKEKLYTAIDVYISDFGTLQITPNRFQRARDVLVIDPEYITQDWLQPMKQTPLAKTGHADERLIAGEYTLSVRSEKAQGLIADINGSL